MSAPNVADWPLPEGAKKPEPTAPPPSETPEWAAPAAPEVDPLLIAGEHRVIVHPLEGTARRGVASDIHLASNGIMLAPSTGAAAEEILFAKTKAVFFLLAPGEHPGAGTGKRVRVTLVDGRQLDGFLGDDAGPGFFLFPLDSRGNTARVFILNHAVKAVT